MAEGNSANSDPRVATEAYLEQHELAELLEALMAQLLFRQPPDPRAWLLRELEKIRVTGVRPLLTRADLGTMFGMFDVTKKGVVNEQQAANALRTLLGARAPAPKDDAASAPLEQGEFVGHMAKVLQAATPFCKGGLEDAGDQDEPGAAA